jgi:DNA polymerase-3 subunit gamma/tau
VQRAGIPLLPVAPLLEAPEVDPPLDAPELDALPLALPEVAPPLEAPEPEPEPDPEPDPEPEAPGLEASPPGAPGAGASNREGPQATRRSSDAAATGGRR